MESCILVDGEWLNRVVGMRCTFEKNGASITWRIKPDFAYRFLVVNGQLVIGAIDSHDELYAAWVLRDEPLSADTRERAKLIAKNQWEARNWAVTGAGKVGADGMVTGWKSECFRVETPAGMRSEIEQEIRRLYGSGALAPH